MAPDGSRRFGGIGACTRPALACRAELFCSVLLCSVQEEHNNRVLISISVSTLPAYAPFHLWSQLWLRNTGMAISWQLYVWLFFYHRSKQSNRGIDSRTMDFLDPYCCRVRRLPRSPDCGNVRETESVQAYLNMPLRQYQGTSLSQDCAKRAFRTPCLTCVSLPCN